MTGRHRNDDDETVTRASTGDEQPAPRRTELSERLGRLASFAELSPRVLQEIEDSMEPRPFTPGEVLMRQGDNADSLIVIREGEVEVKVTHHGNSNVLKRGGPGDVFGEMALLTSEPRTADVVAVSQGHALSLPVEAFHRIALREPGIAEVLSRLTARRLGRDSFDALSGKSFHGYDILRSLARGGMAVVYEAIEQSTERRVALKMMSHKLVFDERARRGFRQEADMIEQMDHPNIARMFGRFEAFHTFFIVMEFCDGRALDRILTDRGALSREDARRILGQLASALHYAHERDIVHRDIKPSNVIVNRDGCVKLLDFGVARTLTDETDDVWGPVTGSPPYMSPEQLSGRPFGKSADLYALAGLAWEMLTGDSLFHASNFRELRAAHRAWDIPSVSSTLPDIEMDLTHFLSNCLRKDPAERCADLERLATWAGPVDPGEDPEDSESGDEGTRDDRTSR